MYSSRGQLVNHRIHQLLSYWGINPKKPEGTGPKAVFFDIDGTLSRQDNFGTFIRFLSLNHIVPPTQARKIIHAHREYRNRRWKFQTFIKHVIQTNELLAGLPRWLLERMRKLSFQEFGATYYVFTYKLLKILENLGYTLIAVSGSPDIVIEEYFKSIKIKPKYIWSTKFIFKDGIFTGEVDASVVADKGKYVLKKAKQYGIDLQQSIAIGDSGDDISLFRVVGRKAGINPNLELANFCIKEKVPIVIERKNFIVFLAEDKYNM